jgi:SAM-dependent methyltransferase
MEEIPVPSNTYDLAYSYNVVEHVVDETSFLAKTIEVLKPGGVYWSMSPNARHPFTVIVRIMQALGIKYLYRRSIAPQANNYPAYYRLCNAAKVLKAIEKLDLPVSKIDFFLIPNVQWDTFFPHRLRFVAHLIDRAIVLNAPSMSNIFMFRIEKTNDGLRDETTSSTTRYPLATEARSVD